MNETVTIKGMKCPIIGYKNIGGKKIPVIKAHGEEIKGPNGRVDVIIKVPAIGLGIKREE